MPPWLDNLRRLGRMVSAPTRCAFREEIEPLPYVVGLFGRLNYECAKKNAPSFEGAKKHKSQRICIVLFISR